MKLSENVLKMTQTNIAPEMIEQQYSIAVKNSEGKDLGYWVGATYNICFSNCFSMQPVSFGNKNECLQELVKAQLVCAANDRQYYFTLTNWD